jgi:acyl carrier protein
MNTADKFTKLVSEHLGVESHKIIEGASFTDDLGADSLDMVEIVMAVEEEFQIEIDDIEAETMATVGEAIALIDKKLQS